MTSKKILVLAAAAAIGAIGITGATAAFADGGVPGAPGIARHMGPGGGHGPMRDGAGAETGPYHDQMHAAAAAALGISVTDLEAQLDAGKTIAQIAQERGVDLTTVQAAMKAARPEATGRGPMGGRFGGGPGAGAGDCPYATTN